MEAPRELRRSSRRACRRDFDSSVWGITPGVTFPYLKFAGADFQSPLAITVLGSEIFTFLPISQLEKSEYSPTISRPDLASKAAAYTIIARAIGITQRIATLQNARINLFWNGSAAVWKGHGDRPRFH